jgi:hypothetical protein
MTNDASAAIRRNLEYKLFSDGVGAGSFILAMEKAGIVNNRNPLINLLGSDFDRIALSSQLLELEKAFRSPQLYLTQGLVERITKKDALRIFSLFPLFILPSEAKPDCREDLASLTEAGNFYRLAGLWLLNWEKDSRYSDFLAQLKQPAAEKRAWTSRRLYELCDYMKIHSDSSYLRPLPVPAMWLLCEISLCKNHLADQRKEGSKRKRYERMQAIYAQLDGFDPANPPNSRVVNGLPDLAEHFYGYFMYLVHQMASNNPEFDRIHYKPYLKAEKAWQRKALSQKDVSAYL